MLKRIVRLPRWSWEPSVPLGIVGLMRETRWERTRLETGRAFHTVKFWLWEVFAFAIAGLLAALLAIWVCWSAMEIALYTFGLLLGSVILVGLVVHGVAWYFSPSKQRDELRTKFRESASFLHAETLLRRLSELRTSGVGQRNKYAEMLPTEDDAVTVQEMYDEFSAWRVRTNEIMKQLSESEAELYSTLDIIDAPAFDVPNKVHGKIVRMWSHHLKNIREFVMRFREHQLIQPPVFNIPEAELLQALEEHPEK